MGQSWVISGIGIFFCITAVYLFYRKAYEEGQRVTMPIMLMVMGVILIALGTAKSLHLIR
jgi:multidrug transporter EmrE-like cation transporter